MIRYILGLKTEPSACSSFCPCNVEYTTELDDAAEIQRDADFDRTADAATGLEDR